MVLRRLSRRALLALLSLPALSQRIFATAPSDVNEDHDNVKHSRTVIVAPLGFDPEHGKRLAELASSLVTPRFSVDGPTPSGMLRLRAAEESPGQSLDDLVRLITDRAVPLGITVKLIDGNAAALLPVESGRKLETTAGKVAAAEPPYGMYFGQLGVLRAWRRTIGEPSVIVAIIDNGVRLDKPLLANNLQKNVLELGKESDIDNDSNGVVDDVDGADFFKAGKNGVAYKNHPNDLASHGTCSAFVAVGARSPGSQLAGVAPGARYIPVRATNGATFSDFDFARCIEYAASRGASIANFSLGVRAGLPATRRAIDFAATREMLLVACAGDVAGDMSANAFFPAAFALDDNDCLPNQIVVMSVGDDLTAAETYSKTAVDIGAPHTARVPGEGQVVKYDLADGSSIAAPYVAGIAALVKSLNPAWWTAVKLRAHLCESGTSHPSLADKCKSGKLVNAANAVLGPLQIVAPDKSLRWDSTQQEQLHWQLLYDSSFCKDLFAEFRAAGADQWQTLATADARTLQTTVNLAGLANKHGKLRLRSAGSNFWSPEVEVVIR